MKQWALLGLCALSLSLGACASQFDSAPQLSRYDQLEPGERGFIDVQEYANDEELARMAAVYIAPVQFAPGVEARSGLSADQLDEVTQHLRGSTCRSLAFSKIRVINEPEPASHILHLFITGLTPTNTMAAGASAVAGFVLPIGARAPMGRGALGVDAEIIDQSSQAQIAAIKWGRQASLAADGGFSEITDALALSEDFADAMGNIVGEARQRAEAEPQQTERGTCDVNLGAHHRAVRFIF